MALERAALLRAQAKVLREQAEQLEADANRFEAGGDLSDFCEKNILKQKEDMVLTAHALNGLMESLLVQVRNGSLTLIAAGERFLDLFLDELAKNNNLRYPFLASYDATWVLIRRFFLAMGRLFSQPRMLTQAVKYIDFATGTIQHSMPSKPPGATRFVVISDTHMRHRDVRLPRADVLVHCGDIFLYGGEEEPDESKAIWRDHLADFFLWLNEHAETCPEVVFVGGNHDTPLMKLGAEEVKRQAPSHATYLCDDAATTAGGLSLYGTCFSYGKGLTGNVAWQLSGVEDRVQKLAAIPENLDILITHGPPEIDAIPFGLKPPPWNPNQTKFPGCNELWKIVEAKKPKVHLFGHIHEAHGAHRVGNTLFVAASTVATSRLSAENPPLVFDFIP